MSSGLSKSSQGSSSKGSQGLMKKIHEKVPDAGGTSRHDSCVKEMYSCTRSSKTASLASNIIGMVISILLIAYGVYRFVNKRQDVALHKVMDFATNQEVFKMFVTLLLLSNIKTLSNSLIANIILPVVKPILPLLACNLKIKVGLFQMNIGEFISDLIVFGMNLYIIYFLFVVMY